MMTTDDLIQLADAAREANLHRDTLRRRLSAAGVPLWNDPADYRRRMVRRADFEAVGLTPRPVGRPRKETVAA